MESKHKCLVLFLLFHMIYTSLSWQVNINALLWHNYLLYIVEVIGDFFMNLAFTKLKLRLTWKLS